MKPFIFVLTLLAAFQVNAANKSTPEEEKLRSNIAGENALKLITIPGAPGAGKDEILKALERLLKKSEKSSSEADQILDVAETKNSVIPKPLKIDGSGVKEMKPSDILKLLGHPPGYQGADPQKKSEVDTTIETPGTSA